MSESELSHVIHLRKLPYEPVEITADEAQRAALAKRFGVTAISELIATVAVTPKDSGVIATGSLTAQVEQPCAVTGENFTYPIAEELALSFVPARKQASPDEEVELEADELDEIEFEGDSFDLGEAIAQSLGLAIDPYAEGPNADEARKSGLVSSEEASGPFAALAALKKD